MKKVLSWLISPAVAPLIARLLLVALTALAAGSPELPLAAGSLAEALARGSRP